MSEWASPIVWVIRTVEETPRFLCWMDGVSGYQTLRPWPAAMLVLFQTRLAARRAADAQSVPVDLLKWDLRSAEAERFEGVRCG